MRNAILPLLVVMGLLLVPVQSEAAPGESTIGLQLGTNWSHMRAPADPVGSPTLMHGTAFDGFGYIVGATFSKTLTEVGGRPLAVAGDILYSHHQAGGFERHQESQVERIATLTTDVLRVPLLARIGLTRSNPSRIYASIGPELWVGFRSGATVELTNTDAQPEPLQTEPVTHLLIDTEVGFDLQVGSEFSIPFNFRASWDPFVKRSTVERFSGYQSMSDPGSYKVAFDWQILAMTGVKWSGLAF